MATAAAPRITPPPTVPIWTPILCLLTCLAVIWGAVAPFGDSGLWRMIGVGASLGGVVGIAVRLATRRLPTVHLAALVAIGIGLWRASDGTAEAPQPWAVPAERIRLLASVEGPVETRGTTASLYAHIDQVLEPAGVEAPKGRVRAILPGLTSLETGQPIEITGRFEAVEAASASGARLARQGVIATTAFPRVVPLGPPQQNVILGTLASLRSSIQTTIERTLPEPHAALLAGLLVGSSAGMPESLRLALIGSGTSHLVVVSGYNISLVAAALTSFFRASPGLRVAAPLLGVWAFTLIAGANAPAVRAAIMATGALVALGTGRGSDALAALALAATAMLLIDPGLVFDLGFQLSVLATLGLITLQPRLSSLFGRLPDRLREPVSTTLAAQVATLPLSPQPSIRSRSSHRSPTCLRRRWSPSRRSREPSD